MNNRINGGNPPQDRKESVEKFRTIVEPKFLSKGFTRIKPKAHILYNSETNTMVFCTAAPSQGPKSVNDFKDRIRKYTKEMGVKSFYIVFNRDYSDWKEKSNYRSAFNFLVKYSKVKGIIVGEENLEKGVDKVVSNKDCILV